MTQTQSSNMSVRQRRNAMLRRTGLAERHKIPLDPPSRVFYATLILVAALVLLGLVMVLSSSSITNIHSGGSAWTYFERQILFTMIGLGVGGAAYKFPYRSWTTYRWLLLLVGVVLGLNVAVAAAGPVVNGARAWLDIGPFRFQPSEFMKPTAILFCANLLSKRHRSIPIKQMVLYPMLGVVAVTGGLCAVQKDYGSAVIFAGIALAMMLIGGLPMAQVLATSAGFFVAGAIVLKSARNARERMLAFLDLEATKEGSGYQVYQAILSIANGGLKGTGVGSGTSKWGYVPLAHSDFIFAVVAEELGIAGAVMVLGGFFALVLLAIRIALGAPDKHGAFIAGGIAAWFGVQAVVNIGGVVGWLPMTGLTLPFISYGGSSLVASMLGAGLLLNVARHMKD